MATGNGLRRLIGLVRVSTEKQAEDEHMGLDRQVETVRNIAEREGVPLELVKLVDVSGSSVAKTPEWRTILERLDCPGTHLAADAVDRLCRASELDLSVLSDLQRRATRLYTAAGIQDFAQPTDRLLGGILSLLGGLEKSEIKRRCKEGKERIRAGGGWAQNAKLLPRGISYDKKGKRWGHNADAAGVRQAYLALIAGCSLRDAARIAGCVFSHIPCLIANPIYRGWRVYDVEISQTERRPGKNGRQDRGKKVKRETPLAVQVYGLPGQEQPLVTDREWAAAQEAVAERGKHRKKETTPYWATGLLTQVPTPTQEFGSWQHEMGRDWPAQPRLYARGPQNRKNDVARYLCTEHCGGVRTLQAEMVHAALDALLTTLHTEPWFLAALRAPVGEPGAVPATTRESEVAATRAKVAALRAKEERFLDLVGDGTIDKATFVEKRDQVRAEISRLQLQLATVAPVQATVDVDAAAAWLATNRWCPSWDAQTKRDWLLKHGILVAVSKEGIESLTIRLPSTDGGTLPHEVWCSSDVPTWATWERLAGRKPRAHASKVQP